MLQQVAGFRQGLQDHGYVEGSNVTIDYRFADQQFDRLPGLVRELIGLKVDVLVTFVTQASVAAKDSTKTIPIVIVGVADPVGAGLVSSLAHPGGNVTGNSSMSAETAGKPLALLKDVVPRIERVAVLWNPKNQVFQTQMLRETEAAARSLGIRLQVYEAHDLRSIENAFEAIVRDRASALNVLQDPALNAHSLQITALAVKARLPSASGIGFTQNLAASLVTGPAFMSCIVAQRDMSPRSSKARSQATFRSSSQRSSSS